MSTYEAVSKSLHKNKRWKPNGDFTFAGQDALCPIALMEAPKASLHLPIAFSKVEGEVGLFVVQGLEVGKNYIVSSTGRWMAEYVPVLYRSFPFSLASTNEEQTLCIDTNSLSDTEGHALYDGSGEPSQQTKEIFNFLTQMSASQKGTLKICKYLEQNDLLEPWPLVIRKNEQELEVKGLFRINEAKFNSLSADALFSLREQGALPLIFCQLLSMQNLGAIARFAQSADTSPSLPEELPFDFGQDDGNISFEGL
ncbi:MAG: SapC family protein [Gammaproteobacteria bacterium]